MRIFREGFERTSSQRVALNIASWTQQDDGRLDLSFFREELADLSDHVLVKGRRHRSTALQRALAGLSIHGSGHRTGRHWAGVGVKAVDPRTP